MTFGSLFAGIGGMDLGLERAGMECKWQVEIDPFCTKVLEKHWPNVKRYGDIRTVGDELERVDLIAGGFPCQDVSGAGPRLGMDGARSGLWAEYARLIGLLRPRAIVVENVKGLLDRGIDRVLGDLASLRYDAEWGCISAAELGAEHLRERIFIIAYPVCEGLSMGGPAGENGANETTLFQGIRSAERVAISGLECSGASRWGGDVHGISRRVDRIKSLGNAVVPQVAEWLGRRIMGAFQ